MGEVYRATDTRLERSVAIKVLPAQVTEDETVRQRFEREARAISRLNHPNICTLHDIGDHEGNPFIVMEIVEGESLQLRLSKGRLDVSSILTLAIQLADALDAAHKEHVIHRDIKPANIIITERGQAKLLDFGLAKLTPHAEVKTLTGDDNAPTIEQVQLTNPRTAVGTVAYMSPEQARGESLDERSDIFSLGTVLYEMVTGNRAFHGQTTAVIFDAILNKAPVAPVHFAPEVPLKLGEIINNAIEKRRELRYQSAADIRADLLRAKRDVDSGVSVTLTATAAASSQVGTPIPSSSAASQAMPSAGTVGTQVQSGVAGSSATPQGSPRTWLYGAFGLIVVAILGMVLFRSGGPPPGTRPGPEQLVRQQIGLATESLAQGDYQAALSRTEAALALAPGDLEAERIRDAAQAGLARSIVADDNAAAPVDTAEQPVATPAAPVVAPTPPVAAAPPPEVATPPPPAAAPAPAPPTASAPAAAPASDRGPTAEPTVSPEVSPALRPEPTVRPDPDPLAEPAAAPVIAPGTDPAPDPLLDPPSPVTNADAPPPAPDPQIAERQIERTLATFVEAIEQKDLALYRSVRPSLSADDARRLEAGFAAVESQQVELQILSIDIVGERATVRVSRRDIVQIDGREQVADTMQTMTLRQQEGDWMIEEIES